MLPETVVLARRSSAWPASGFGSISWIALSAGAWADATERALAAVADPARGAPASRVCRSRARVHGHPRGRTRRPSAPGGLPSRRWPTSRHGGVAFVVACLGLGAAALAQGQPREAVRWLGEAKRAGHADGQVFTTLIAAGQEVSILSMLGERRLALATGQAALAYAAEQHLSSPRGTGRCGDGRRPAV